MKKVHKRAEKGSPNTCIFEGISRFPRKWESEFRLRRLERSEVHAMHFLVFCFHFCHNFVASFLCGFWFHLELKKVGSAEEAGPPYLNIIERIPKVHLCNRARSAPGLLPTA